MKKFLPLALAILLAALMCACSQSNNQETETQAESEVESVIETTTEETIYGLLYAVTDEETMTNQFSCVGGTLTPERIAAGYTGWTGINFGLTSEIDEDAKTITITWKSTSAMATGDLTANDGFTFETTAELQKFMTDSITKGIEENMGEYTLTFEVAE